MLLCFATWYVIFHAYIRSKVAQLEDAKAELAWLEAEEESRRLEKKLAGEKEGLRKLRLFCQSKAREEIACRETAVARYKRARCRKVAWMVAGTHLQMV